MLALLADIGSTFTKMTAVDLERAEIVATAQAPTTIEDVNVGLRQALRGLEEQAAIEPAQIAYRLACSSAAGGLRMVSVGLIPELSVDAARRAALGAGAKVVGVFSHRLNQADLEAIERLHPDIVLLTGGTDGGNERAISHNAQALAGSAVSAPVVVAGNRATAQAVAATLHAGGHAVWVTENVMPAVGELNVRPAQEAIRQIFLERIVVAKGYDRARESFSGVLMPTPSAVLRAAELLAAGTEDEPGWGDLVVVDVGGATTDVHSIGHGLPTKSDIMLRGLPEPYAKRTVEGDMGIRHNARTILEGARAKRLCRAMGQELSDIKAAVGRLSAEVDYLPQNGMEERLDAAMARAAVETAMNRHAGTIQVAYTSFGSTALQHGKDLTDAAHLIGTGGIFVHSKSAGEVLAGALFTADNPVSLRPKHPRQWIDRRYVVAAIGLLADREPTLALRTLKKVLDPL